MSYPGNSDLAADIRQRILTTYAQTLNLAASGENQEAVLGCDFILRLDPEFEPARQLLERLKASDGAVEVEDLKLDTAANPPAPPPAAPSAAPPAGQAPEVGSEDLSLEFQSLFESRQYQRLLDQAQRHQKAVENAPELRRLVEQARSRLEAGPYIQGFLSSARSAIEAGNLEEADRMLARAKSLDPSHPALAQFQELRKQAAEGGDVQAAPAAEPVQPVQHVKPEGVDSVLTTQPIQIAPDLGSEPDRGAEEEAPMAPAGGDAAGMGGDSRIAQLLADGQQAFDEGDFQEAVDAWSRIFLIDIDHQEAARRIEEARKLKAEQERKVEETYHQALRELDAGKLEEARAAFEKVLQLQPSHMAAAEYMQKIDAGSVTAPGAEASEPEEAPIEMAAEPEPAPEEPAAEMEEELREEILVPPEEADVRPRARPAAPRPAAKPSGAGRRFLMIGGAVSVVAVVAGLLLYLNWDRFFRNLPEQPPSASQEATGGALDPVARATSLYQEGQTARALTVLQRLPPSHPRYEEAQALIAQWQTPVEKEVVEETDGPSAEDLARRQTLLQQAHQAFTSRHYRRAADLFEEVAELAPLDDSGAGRLEEARQQISGLREEIRLFRQGEWERVLPILWRLREKQPANPVVVDLIVDAYYNLGVRQLQRGDAREAAEMFQEALSLAPDDKLLRRSYLFATTYSERTQDLLYRTYVKYLPFR